MRFHKTRRLRIASGATLLLVLAGLPMLLGLTRPAASDHPDMPGVVRVYATGLNSLGVAGLVALGFALAFALWLIAGQRREVGRRYLGKNARSRQNIIETLRTLAIIFGAAGLIVGSLSGLYSAMMHARPDLYVELPLPFFTVELALICLTLGGGLYAAGRIGR